MCVLRAPLLDDGDAHDHEDETQEHQRISRLAHGQVESAGGDQQHEHRLPGYFHGNDGNRPRLAGRQLVWALGSQPPRSGVLIQPRDAGEFRLSRAFTSSRNRRVKGG